MDTLAMLEELLEQDQFELLIPKDGMSGELRLVYLMNDAVESFLVFKNARMTGAYLEDYEGELTYSISKDGRGYALVVWQGEHAVTILFEMLELEVHLYDYGEIAHFWVPKYEYLRQLEYRIAILRDKYEYLGPEYCTPEEQKLAHLAYFPPLNYCCYPAVPEKYIVPIEDPWNPSEQALNVMEELAEKAGNRKLGRMLLLYRRFPYPLLAKRIATMLHRTSCMNVVDLLDRCLRETVKKYPRRSFGKQADREFERLLSLAEKKKEELEKQGIRADVLREEPFTTAQDNLEVHVYLMIWETRGRDRQVRIETIEQGKEGSTW